MITWIQKTFQQHFRIIFLVLLVVVIISFIFVTNASGGFGRNSDYRAAKKPFFGLDLSNDRDAQHLMRDAYTSAFLQFGGLRDGDIQEFAQIRQAMLYTADQLHVPAPTDTELKAYIQSLRIFTNAQGQFDATLYNSIRQDPTRLGQNLTPGDFARILSDDARIASTNKLISGPGYILPADVQQILKQADSTWTLQTATIDRNSFKPSITPSELELSTYFQNNPARYTIQPRVRVSYAELPAAMFSAATIVTEPEIRAYYDANPARFPKPAAAPATMAAPATPDGDYALVRPQVEAELRQQRANAAANQAASDLAYKLYAERITIGSPEFNRLLTQSHAILNMAPDFSANDIPAQLGANRAAIAKEAFSLDAKNRVSNAVNTGNGAVILFWQESIPSREPAFAEARDKVAADYVAQETQKRFVALGQTMKGQIETSLKSGSSFEQAVTKVASTAGLTATTKTLAPFTLRQPGQDVENYVYAALETLKQGDVSSMRIVENAGHFVYAQNVKLPDLTEANPNYALYAGQLAARNATSAAMQYAQNLVQAELAKSAPAQK